MAKQDDLPDLPGRHIEDVPYVSGSRTGATLARADTRSAGHVLWPATAVFLLAGAVRLAVVSEVPAHPDEYYHVLAARSWIEDGTFRILDGEYLRTPEFTILTGWSFKIFGVSFAAGRLPSVIAGAALVASLFVWMRCQAGMAAAWISALMLCFASVAVELSALVRFYMPHALLIWLGSVFIYEVMAGPQRRTPYWMLLAAGALFAAAWRLQVSTMIAVVAVIVWALVDAILRISSQRLIIDRRIWGLAAVAVVAALLALSLGLFEQIEELYRALRHVELWNIGRRDEIAFYYRRLNSLMPLLWNLFPAAAIIAVASRPRAALFCILLFAISMVIHSLAGMKELRYVFYALPFFFAIWGIALGTIGPLFLGWTHKAFDKLFGEIGSRQITGKRIRQAGVIVVAIIVASVAIVGNPVFKQTADMLARSGLTLAAHPARLFAHPPDEPWHSYGDELRRLIRSASVVITGESLRLAFYAGDFDLHLSRATLDEASGGVSPQHEFVLDPKTGRPVISSVNSVRRVMECYPDGVVVIRMRHWRDPLFVTDEVADFLEDSARLTRFAAWPPSDELLVFEWKRAETGNGADCDEISRIVARAS